MRVPGQHQSPVPLRPPTPHTQVHSGADLQASASAAAQFVPGSAKGYLGYVLSHSNGAQGRPRVGASGCSSVEAWGGRDLCNG